MNKENLVVHTTIIPVNFCGTPRIAILREDRKGKYWVITPARIGTTFYEGYIKEEVDTDDYFFKTREEVVRFLEGQEEQECKLAIEMIQELPSLLNQWDITDDLFFSLGSLSKLNGLLGNFTLLNVLRLA